MGGMATKVPTIEAAGWMTRQGLGTLFAVLSASGYRVIGPTVRDDAILYEPLDDADQLPRAVQDEQAPGHYRLKPAPGERRFAWAVGPQALKPLLFRPRENLWSCEWRDKHLHFSDREPIAERLAVIGVRACDLAALRLTDAHFFDGPTRDRHYVHAREHLLLIAVHCTHPAATCFCASTGDGPRAREVFDLALSECDDGYIVETGSPAGRQIAAQLALAPIDDARRAAADAEIEQAARRQTRRMPAALRGRLRSVPDHARWEAVAARCLSCGNCTAVCPTCFCHRETEMPALDSRTSVHGREWDSCFTQGHSYIHGFTVRADTRTRYRQWLTHKLDTWFDQYGRAGCVGCGRCISWCPVGIDLTEEATALVARAGDRD